MVGKCEKVCWDKGEVGGDVRKCWGRCEKVFCGVGKGEGRCGEVCWGVERCWKYVGM